jgi:multicomponent Na+:H+ antiporter subunit A/multicomponent Na+:H+ antiporter subunit C
MTNQLEAAVLVAVLFGAGIYLMLSRRFLRILFGFLMASNAANIVLIGISGDPTGKSSGTVGAGGAGNSVDPLPQALILTAIVIGFAVASYLTVLLYRLHADRRGTSLTTLNAEEKPGTPAACAKEAGQ